MIIVIILTNRNYQAENREARQQCTLKTKQFEQEFMWICKRRGTQVNPIWTRAYLFVSKLNAVQI